MVTEGEGRWQEGRRRVRESDATHSAYTDRINSWMQRNLQSPCPCYQTIPVRNHAPNTTAFGDSYAAVLRGVGVMNMVHEAAELIHDVWWREVPCVRLIKFMQFADKHYTVLASTTACNVRRLFLMVRAKVIKFCQDLELAMEYGWEVHCFAPLNKPFCRCAGRHRHTLQSVHRAAQPIRVKYEQVPPLAARLHQLLSARMCDDLATQIVAQYYNHLIEL